MIYLASSWRNEHQPQTLDLIRRAGYEVYDFRNPTDGVGGIGGFSWSKLDGPGYDSLPPPSMWSAADLALALRHPVAVRGHGFDQAALDHATACVLLLPCGSSAHLEAGYCAGRGVPTVVYAPSAIREPELMYLTFGPTPIVTTHEELMAWLARAFSPVAERLDPHLQVHRRQAGLARARIADIAAGHHRDQRVTAADLVAVQAQERPVVPVYRGCVHCGSTIPSSWVACSQCAAERGVSVGDPIEVRELPTIGGRPPPDSLPILDWISRLPRAAQVESEDVGGRMRGSCGMLDEHRTIDEMSDTIRRLSSDVETLRSSLRSAMRDINSLHSELDTRYRERNRILDLLTVENDGPEGSMPPSWYIGQIRQLLGVGIASEHDAETLDLRDPEWPEPTWRGTAENLRAALAQTTDERDAARRDAESKTLVIRDHQRREAVANQCFDILVAARLINRLPESQDLKIQLLREGCQRAATMRFHFEQIRAILGVES